MRVLTRAESEEVKLESRYEIAKSSRRLGSQIQAKWLVSLEKKKNPLCISTSSVRTQQHKVWRNQFKLKCKRTAVEDGNQERWMDVSGDWWSAALWTTKCKAKGRDLKWDIKDGILEKIEVKLEVWEGSPCATRSSADASREISWLSAGKVKWRKGECGLKFRDQISGISICESVQSRSQQSSRQILCHRNYKIIKR